MTYEEATAAMEISKRTQRCPEILVRTGSGAEYAVAGEVR